MQSIKHSHEQGVTAVTSPPAIDGCDAAGRTRKGSINDEKDNQILAGGPVVGRIALRLIVEADSLPDVDRVVSSLPVWPLAETRVTPLVAFSDRRESVQALWERLTDA